jgi:glycosyltransferase involved in cell wall biosynthesis
VFSLVAITVIIPVHNTEKYLRECLDSVCNQSFTDIEIICVNDGSTDSSLRILKEYELLDNRIRIISQRNKGLGAARNVGISQARGEYILFLDSDDYLELTALEETYNIVVEKSLDFVMFKIINFDYKTRVKSTAAYFEMNFLKDYVGDEVFNLYNVKNHIFNISVTATSKLFKKELIEEVLFPEGLIFEDNLFFIKVLFKAHRIYFYERYLYNRRVHPDSITNSGFKNFSDCIEIYDLIIEFIKKINKLDEFGEQLFNRQCRDLFQRFSQLPDEYKQDYYDKMKASFIKNTRDYERFEILKICSERSLEIYKNALISDSYKSFELSINLFDLKRQYDRLQLDNDILKRQYQSKLNQLNQEKDDSSAEITDMKNSLSWRIIDAFQRIINYFRKE